MPNDCLVAGKIVCKKKPVVGAGIAVTLLDHSKQPMKYTARTKSVADGDWAVSIETKEMDVADIAWARVEITCKGQPKKTVMGKVRMSKGEGYLDLLKTILKEIAEELLKRVLRLDKIDFPIVSTKAKLAAWGGPRPGKAVDCCP
ncbi:MAG: hypothetical protein HYY85_11925 [Deltaproteobacteria bacterium]|nr:hypothetical protein [Deltaproteobacteria bacterium]